jgi:hypothetical protein
MVVAVFSGMWTLTPVTVSQLYCDSCGGVNMTKVRCSYSAKLRGFIQQFCGKHFSTDGKILFCKFCEVWLMVVKCFCVQQHCDTIKHTHSLSPHFIYENRQCYLKMPQLLHHQTKHEFSKDFCEIMVSANILLHKVNNQQLRNFLEKYMNHYIPTDSQHYEKIIYLSVTKTF